MSDGYASGSAVYYPNGHNVKPAGLARNWILLLIAQIGLVAFCLQGLADCTGGYCSELITGVALGMICGVVVMGYFVGFMWRRKRTEGRAYVGEMGGAVVALVCSSVNAGVLTSTEGEEKSINVYFASWISFFLSLGLCLKYFDAYLYPGSLMSSVEYNNWLMRSRVAEKSEKRMYRKQSTGSTKSSHSAERFQAHLQIAAEAQAHLESMVASHDSSEPILYLDNGLNASVLSMGGVEEEYGDLPQLPRSRLRDNPSRYVPQTGVDPDASVGTPSEQRTVTASATLRNKDPASQGGMDLVESVSSHSDFQRGASRRASLASCQTMEPPEVLTAPPMPARPKFSPPPRQSQSSKSKCSPSRDRLPHSNMPTQSSMRKTGTYDKSVGAQSMTAFITTSAPSKSFGMSERKFSGPQYSFETTSFSSYSSKKSGQPVRDDVKNRADRSSGVKASIISLFDEGNIAEAAQAARASMEQTSVIMEGTISSSIESSLHTLEPPPTLDPNAEGYGNKSPNAPNPPPFTLSSSISSKAKASLSPSMKAALSVKSGKTIKSKESKSVSKASPSYSRSQSYPSRASKGSQGLSSKGSQAQLSRTHSTPSSRARSTRTPSSGKSRASTKASSAAKSSITGGSRGPPTLSEDGSSEPLTMSEDDEEDQVYEVDLQSQSIHGRPVFDISTDNLSVVSDPTMDGFDQSQKTPGSYRRKESHATLESDVQELNQGGGGSVDVMVMLALKQAYESRKQSLRQQSGESVSRANSSRAQSPAQQAPAASESKRSGSGDVKSIRSFYSHGGDTQGDESGAFIC